MVEEELETQVEKYSGSNQPPNLTTTGTADRLPLFPPPRSPPPIIPHIDIRQAEDPGYLPWIIGLAGLVLGAGAAYCLDDAQNDALTRTLEYILLPGAGYTGAVAIAKHYL